MRLKTLFAVCCTAYLATAAQAQELIVKKDVQEKTNLMEERVTELFADRIKKETVLKDLSSIHELTMEEVLARESLMYPAEEIYGYNWENKNVNPFVGKSITFPDSATIDCSSFVLPIDVELKVTSKYGMRRRRMHRGIDLKVQIGDTIRAAFDGKIRIRSTERGGYGHYVVIRHTNGLETVYGHLSRFLVRENDIVRAGDAIGLGGNSGRSTGSHLHFETRFLGQDINPGDIIDFENGVPHKDLYVFRNVKVNGQRTNIFTTSDTQIAYYKIKSGDTLGAIARRYGTTVGELCRLNGLKTTTILRIGQAIRVNAKEGTPGVVEKKVSTVEEIKKEVKQPVVAQTSVEKPGQKALPRPVQNQTQETKKAEQNPVHNRIAQVVNNPSTTNNKAASKTVSGSTVLSSAIASSAKTTSSVVNNNTTSNNRKTPVYSQQAGEIIYHRIKSGDTLGAIARKYGTTVKKLCELNGISETTILRLGKNIRCS